MQQPSLIETPPKDSQKNLRWAWRKLVQTSIGAGLILIVMTVWTTTFDKGRDTFEHQANTLVREMVKQAELSYLFAQQAADDRLLKMAVNNLAQSKIVIDANIYDAKGVVLAQSDDALSVLQATGLKENPQQTKLIPIIEPIMVDGSIQAYIRVTFDYHAIHNQTLPFHMEFSGQTRLMLLLCFIIGIVFTRIFSKRR
ncbi:hypothetical protein C2869_07165 [Saccharobesus litoralis]|uniref:Uncharacterized protein n=1 Tax=Saccharobesus litoralis TaxID=2172099 RepID=A0A2S0VPT6_9ALTE|nr:AhpA/YtjB family protein [Saccharobesus litoralis]AWB66228.1 hypothetical protein C2869_07165 [Saccharobesus litoralis]